MKTRLLILLPFAIMVIASCGNSQCEHVANEGHSCSKSCSAKADKKSGKFDFAMSSFCQQSCGVSGYDISQITAITEAKVGDVTMCPVSGAIYRVKEGSPTLHHDGKTFYSCCNGCADKFNDDPERFYKNVVEMS